MTYEDYLFSLLPASVHDRLYLRLGNFVEERDLGIVLFAPFDVLLSPHDVVQPDLLLVSKERAEIVVERYVHGAPDLVIEVLSKSTRRRDERLKLERYDRFGVREYWMVDTERKTARIFRREGGRLVLAAQLSAAVGNNLTSSLLPGFEIPLNEIFSSINPSLVSQLTDS